MLSHDRSNPNKVRKEFGEKWADSDRIGRPLALHRWPPLVFQVSNECILSRGEIENKDRFIEEVKKII